MTKYMITYRHKQGESIEADGFYVGSDFIRIWEIDGWSRRTVMLIAKDIVEDIRKEEKNV